MTDYIESDFEFFEVLNEFPILKDYLRDLHFNLSNVIEGETVRDYFEKNHMSEREIEIIVKRLNRDLTLFIKKGAEIYTPSQQEERLSNEVSESEEEEE